MPDYARLPFAFDPQRLADDLSRIAPDEWVAHFNTGFYEGGWRAVPLRSVGGRAGHIYADPHAPQAFADTPVLDRCPCFREVLAAFECPLQSVRLLCLDAGSRIREHRDYNLGPDEALRLHVPVRTNPDVYFYLDGERVVMQAGECWYLDLGLPHRVENAGTEARIHLVLDCEPNAWLRDVLEAAGVSTAVAPRVHTPDEARRIAEELRRLGTDAALAAAAALAPPAQPP